MEPQSPESEQQKAYRIKDARITRRGIIKTALGFGAAAAAGTILKDQTTIPTPPTKETPTPIDNEQDQFVDDETVNHLTFTYGLAMDERYFPSDKENSEFMKQLVQAAHRINPDNNNLANQLATIICFDTKTTFSPDKKNEQTGNPGIFQLSEAALTTLSLSAEDYLSLAPSEQLSIMEKYLISQQTILEERVGKKFTTLSELFLAKDLPSAIGSADDSILFTKGTATYEKYQHFDQEKIGEITLGMISQTLIDYGIDHGEFEEYLYDPDHPPVYDFPPFNEDRSEEKTKADIATAEWLTKIYRNKCTDPFFTSDAECLSFMKEVTRIAYRLNNDNSKLANQIAAVMNFETWGDMRSSARNRSTKATGLIQFMPDTARGLGTNISRLARMNPLQQLAYVEHYLHNQQETALGFGRNKFNEISDVYMAVLWPDAVGRKETFGLFEKGTDAYTYNSGLDTDGDGVVTKKEASQQVVDAAIAAGEQKKYLLNSVEA